MPWTWGEHVLSSERSLFTPDNRLLPLLGVLEAHLQVRAHPLTPSPCSGWLTNTSHFAFLLLLELVPRSLTPGPLRPPIVPPQSFAVQHWAASHGPARTSCIPAPQPAQACTRPRAGLEACLDIHSKRRALGREYRARDSRHDVPKDTGAFPLSCLNVPHYLLGSWNGSQGPVLRLLSIRSAWTQRTGSSGMFPRYPFGCMTAIPRRTKNLARRMVFSHREKYRCRQMRCCTSFCAFASKGKHDTVAPDPCSRDGVHHAVIVARTCSVALARTDCDLSCHEMHGH